MKKYFMAAVLLSSQMMGFSQFKVIKCISGDCNNGTGEANLDNFRNYRGAFKNGLPDGIGLMLNVSYYEETPEYAGEFKQGYIHGKGTILYKKNAEYADAVFANGKMIKGTIYFETGETAIINNVKAVKTGELYSGKMIDPDKKETPFTDQDLSNLQEMAYNTGNITRNPKLMEELSADLKSLTSMFESKFAQADRLISLYSELLQCLPDDMGCAGNRLNSIENQSQFFTYEEALKLDARVQRIENNFLDYRTRPGTTSQQKIESVQLVKLIGDMLSRYINGQLSSIIESAKKAVLAANSPYNKGEVSVMKANFPFQKMSAKENREKNWETWKILTQNF